MKASKLLMLSLVSLTMLVGCGGDQPNPDPTPEEPTNETQTHKISIGETDGATVTPSKTSAESGEEITLTIVVPKGKEVDKVTSSVDGVEITPKGGNQYSFLMPRVDIVISVKLKDKLEETYALTIQNEDNVEIITILDSDSNEQSATNGVYNLIPNNYYLLRTNPMDGVVVTLNGEQVSKNEDYFYFIMSTEDSTLVITKQDTFSISVTYDPNAVLDLLTMDAETGESLTVNSVAPGTKVAISYGLANGYKVIGATLNGEPIEATTSQIAEFEMPSENVTINIQTEIDEDVAGVLVQLTEGEGSEIIIGDKYEFYGNGDLKDLTGYYPNGTRFEEGKKLYAQFNILNLYKDSMTLTAAKMNDVEVQLDDKNVFEFTVGTENIMLEAVVSKIQHSLTFNDEGTGAKCVFTNEAGETITTAGLNDTVKATFTPANPSEVLTNVYVNGKELSSGELSGNTYTFLMQKEDVIVTAKWANLDEKLSLAYTSNFSEIQDQITVKFYSDSELTTEITEADPMSTIYLTVEYDDEYILDRVSFDGTNLQRTVYGGKSAYSFETVNEDVNLDLTFSKANGLHNITFDYDKFGGVGSVKLYSSLTGEELPLSSHRGASGITFYISPVPSTGDIYANDVKLDVESFGQEQELGAKLVMPDEDVIITIK